MAFKPLRGKLAKLKQLGAKLGIAPARVGDDARVDRESVPLPAHAAAAKPKHAAKKAEKRA